MILLSWFQNHIGTIAVALAVTALFAVIIRKLIRDKKQGKTACGCGCSACAMRGQCGTNKK